LVNLPEHEQISYAISCEFDEKRATKPKFVAQSRPDLTLSNNFLQPAANVLLRDKLITLGEKRETSAKSYNETMLRDKLRVFASRISPP